MKKKRKGFTLIELIIVIAILGILAAIAIPKYNVSRLNAAVTAHKANVQMLKSAARMKILEKDEDFNWPDNTAKSSKSHIDYVEKWPDIPKELKTESIKEYKVEYNYNDNKLTVTPSENAFDDKIKK